MGLNRNRIKKQLYTHLEGHDRCLFDTIFLKSGGQNSCLEHWNPLVGSVAEGKTARFVELSTTAARRWGALKARRQPVGGADCPSMEEGYQVVI